MDLIRFSFVIVDEVEMMPTYDAWQIKQHIG